jgi:hypothetical protein
MTALSQEYSHMTALSHCATNLHTSCCSRGAGRRLLDELVHALSQLTTLGSHVNIIVCVCVCVCVCVDIYI